MVVTVCAGESTASVQISHYHTNVVLITKNTEVYSVVNDRVLSLLFARSKKIICRSGYSTIMDLLVLGKSALLVPTPGQYEQEYLAERLNQRPEFYVVAQNEFNYNTISLFVND